MSGLTASTARTVRGRVLIGLTAACSTLVNGVERLCDHDLSDAERETRTDEVYDAMAEIRLALGDLAEVVVGTDERAREGAEVVVQVSRSQFRRHRWSRHLRRVDG